MAGTTASNVTPLAYSLKYVAKRLRCSPQEALDRVMKSGTSVYVKDGECRVPRGAVTGYDTRYDTRAAWSSTRQPA